MFSYLTARRRILTFGIVLAAVATLAAHPTWARSIGADVWNVPALKDRNRALAEENRRMEAEGEDVRHRIAVKETLVADLIAGRSTLAETTAQFTTMNASRPEYMSVIRDAFPGATDQEKMARNVIAFAVVRVAPEHRAELARRLDGELRQLVAGSPGR